MKLQVVLQKKGEAERREEREEEETERKELKREDKTAKSQEVG